MRTRRLACWGVVLALMTGCGGPTCPVHGTVTIDGQPLDQGEIEFRPLEGTLGPIAGGPIRDGRYALPADDRGLRPGGRYRVSVSSLEPTGRMAINPSAPSGQQPELRERLPARYNAASELIITVPTGGGQLADIAVSTK